MAMALILIICYLFLLRLVICEHDKTCLDGWTMNYNSGYCYKKFSEKLSFDEAEASCEEVDQSSHLTSFSSKEEFDFLAAIDDPYAFWIGMRHNGIPKEGVDILEKNRFDMWFVDGSPDYHFYDEDYGHYWGNTSMPGEWNIYSMGWEPNGHDDQEYQCVNLYSLSAQPSKALYQGKMNDVGCDERFAYVCKTEARQQDDPTTFVATSTEESTNPTTELSTEIPSTTQVSITDSSSTTIEATSTENTTTGSDLKKCLDGWSYFQGSDSCFKKFSEKLSFDKAEASCQEAANNSHLASFSSQEEFDFLAEIYDDHAFWIGMKHNGIPKKFSVPLEREQFDVFFIDGSVDGPVFFEDYDHFWGSGRMQNIFTSYSMGYEPNGDHDQPQCIHLFSKNSADDENTYRGKMNDGDCDEALAYVCKTKAEKHDVFPSAQLADSTETASTVKPKTTSSTETSAENTNPIDQQKCLDGWSYFQGSDNCFKIFSEKLSFDEAEESCQQSTENAHLASFSSREEFTFLAQIQDTNAFWIGMKHNGTLIEEDEDKGKNRFDVWFVDGSPDYHFSDKDYGYYWLRIYSTYYEPNGNGGQAQCIHMLTGIFFYGANHGKMNDGDCDEKLAYVCKVKAKEDKASTTESTTRSTTITEINYTTKASTASDATASTSTGSSVECLDGWSYHYASHSCYKKFDSALPFHKAEEMCQEYSSDTHLASFNNMAEFDFLRSVPNPAPLRHYWVGLRHNATPIEGVEFGSANRFTLAFVDQSDVPDFTPYNYYWDYELNHTTGQQMHEPNGLQKKHYKEACVELYSYSLYYNLRGQLNDNNCNLELPYACRMKLAKTTVARRIRKNVLQCRENEQPSVDCNCEEESCDHPVVKSCTFRDCPLDFSYCRCIKGYFRHGISQTKNYSEFRGPCVVENICLNLKKTRPLFKINF